MSGSLRIRSESSKRAEEQGGRARRRTASRASCLGRAIGLVDSKDWVIEELQAEIAKLNKKKKSASD